MRANILIWSIPPARRDVLAFQIAYSCFASYKLEFGLINPKRTHGQAVEYFDMHESSLESFPLYSLFGTVNTLHSLVMAHN